MPSCRCSRRRRDTSVRHWHDALEHPSVFPPSSVPHTLFACHRISPTHAQCPPTAAQDGAKPRPSHLHSRPRPAASNQRQALPVLPPSFGRNQLLPVPNSTRALLEDIVNSFEAPIRYAFAYGSGVFEQAGYNKPAGGQAMVPCLISCLR